MTQSNIAGAINAAHAGVEAAKREGARYAVECGRLLAQAKETVPHGGWDAWLRLNTAVSPRTAQLYMRIVQHVRGDPAKAQRVADLSVREAAAESSRPKRTAAARKQPLPPEGEAWLAQVDAAWNEIRDKPDWKERAARDLHRQGFISREQRNNIIKAARYIPNLTGQDHRAAADKCVKILRENLSQRQMAELLAMFEQAPDLDTMDIAIALGDIREQKQRQVRGI